MLRDIAAGIGMRTLNLLAENYQKLKFENILTFDRCWEFERLGVSPFHFLSQQHQKPVKDIRQETESGKVTFEKVKSAFIYVTSKNGPYYNLYNLTQKQKNATELQ